MKVFRAKACQSPMRKGWSIMFQHPFKKDERGRSHPFVKRFMYTEQHDEIDILVEEMNELLRVQDFWTSTAKGRAKARYDERVVNAFYNDIEKKTSEQIDSEYEYVHVIGEQGSGKTSLIRQLLGIKKECGFLGIGSKGAYSATYKVKDSQHYEAAVSFFTRSEVQRQLEKILLRSAEVYAEGGTDYDLVFELLHGDSSFNLRALLGDIPYKARYFNDDVPLRMSDENSSFKQFVDAIKRESEIVKDAVDQEGRDFAEVWHKRLECRKITEQMLLAIESRLREYKEGTWEIGEDDWPISCRLTAKELSFFDPLTNEEEENNGRLIYPLFRRIEVSGPFSFKKGVAICEHPSVEYTGTIHDSFKQAASILYVHHGLKELDIQFLKQLIVHGHGAKVNVCVTHGDLLTSPSCRTGYAKKHAMAKMIDGALKSVSSLMRKQLHYYLTVGNTSILECVHEESEESHFLYKDLKTALVSETRKKQQELHPIYLNLTVSQAFYEAMESLSIPYMDRETCLNISLGENEGPVPAIASAVISSVYEHFLSQPSGWSSTYHSVTDRQQVIQELAGEFATVVYSYFNEQLLKNARKDWLALYKEKEDDQPYKYSRVIESVIPAKNDIYQQQILMRTVYQLIKYVIEKKDGVMVH